MINDSKICPVCGTELKAIETKYVTLLKRNVTSYEDCKVCEQNELKAKVERERKLLFEKLIESNVGRKYFRLIFDNLTPNGDSFQNAVNRARKYCEVANTCKDKGMGIYFYGNNGSGKTTIMACMIKELLKKHYSCYIINSIELAQGMIDNTLKINEIKDIDFLFLDDIGTEKSIKNDDTSWISEKLFEIIAYRDKEMLPTIFSSNMTISELLKNGMMKKTVERIFSLSTVSLEVITNGSFRLRDTTEIPF